MNAWFFSASRAGCLSVLAMGLISAAPPALAQDIYPVRTPDTSTISSISAASAASKASAISQEKLDSLLAPIALYPDVLLAQVLMASTYPLDVLEAARWQRENPDLSEEALQDALASFDWDPSVKSLVTVPQVLQYMSDSPRWMQDLGDAVMDDQQWVMASVQELRKKAYAAGMLTSNDKQTVDVDSDAAIQYITITPSSPGVIYVPVYDPYVVYGSWWWRSRPFYWGLPPGAFFNSGFFWSNYYYPSVALWGGFNWGFGTMIINVPVYRTYHRASPPPRPNNVWRPAPVSKHAVRGRDRAYRSSVLGVTERSSGQRPVQRLDRSSMRSSEPVRLPQQGVVRSSESSANQSYRAPESRTSTVGRSSESRPTRQDARSFDRSDVHTRSEHAQRPHHRSSDSGGSWRGSGRSGRR